MDEEQTTKEEEQKTTKEDNREGVQSETVKEIERINADTERLNKAIAEKENADARAKIAGVSDAGQPKPTAEEEEKAKAQKAADEIVNAFK